MTFHRGQPSRGDARLEHLETPGTGRSCRESKKNNKNQRHDHLFVRKTLFWCVGTEPE